MARRRRRRGRKRASRRRSSGRKHRNNFGPAKLSWPARALIAAVGAAAAQAVPGLNKPITPTIPVTYGAALGAFLGMKGRGDTLRFLGLGMVMGGGLVPAVQQVLQPAFSRMALAPAGTPGKKQGAK